MTEFAQGDAIAYREHQMRKVGFPEDVVGFDIAFGGAAQTAGVFIPGEDPGPPLLILGSLINRTV